MVGGFSRVNQDILPYTVGGGVPYKIAGPNRVGLTRHGIPFKTRQLLTTCFKLVYRKGLRLEEALSRIEAEIEMIPEVVHFLSFCRSSRRGLIGLQGVTRTSSEGDPDLDLEEVLDEHLAAANDST